MTLFIQLLSFVILTTVADYTGTWEYKISTPDGNINGALVLEKEGDDYVGVISAYGTEYPITDVDVEDNKLTFKTNAAGYSSKISGMFEGNEFKATIYVEGMQIPMTATKKE